MRRPFTGWHMTAILVVFFSVVVGVNIVMARAAISTFGGTVVENSYVASQKFNSWLDKADAQKALGWTVASDLTADRHIRVTVAARQKNLSGASVRAIVRHPLGRAPEQSITFVPRDGEWISAGQLPAGRWLVHLTINRGANRYQRIDTLQ